jgi:hypothetical protein
MKKILFLLFSCSVLAVQAQLQPVLKNRRGISILPQRGDYCIGFSANPFLGYLGNMFNNSTQNNSPNIIASNQMFFAKYMKTSTMAYRASFNISVNNRSEFTNVKDISPGAPVNSTVTDVWKQRQTRFGITLGIEKRKGETRLQGYYGGELMINYNSGPIVKYEYGNKLENYDTGTIFTSMLRGSSVFSFGVAGFAGVEYFVAPRISLGGEINYGPSFNFGSASEQTTTMYDFNQSAATDEKTTLAPRSRGFSLNTNNAAGVVKVLFYF